MVNAVFVAPFFAETTLRFVDAAADLPDVRLGLISQDDEQNCPRTSAKNSPATTASRMGSR